MRSIFATRDNKGSISCSSAFSLRASLQRHESTVHSKVFGPDTTYRYLNPWYKVQKKAFIKKDNLKGHVRRCGKSVKAIWSVFALILAEFFARTWIYVLLNWCFLVPQIFPPNSTMKQSTKIAVGVSVPLGLLVLCSCVLWYLLRQGKGRTYYHYPPTAGLIEDVNENHVYLSPWDFERRPNPYMFPHLQGDDSNPDEVPQD